MPEKRPRGLARRPDFGVTAEDRLLGAPSVSGATEAEGASVASREPEKPTARRRPLKVDAELAEQLRNAVLFLRGCGQPTLTQNELIDELIANGLERLRKDLNGGADFPSVPRRQPVRSH